MFSFETICIVVESYVGVSSAFIYHIRVLKIDCIDQNINNLDKIILRIFFKTKSPILCSRNARTNPVITESVRDSVYYNFSLCTFRVKIFVTRGYFLFLVCYNRYLKCCN